MTTPAPAPAGTASRPSRTMSRATATVAGRSDIMPACEYGSGARSSNDRADLLPHAEADRSLSRWGPGQGPGRVGGPPSGHLHRLPARGRGPARDANTAAAGPEPGRHRTGAGLDRVLARNRSGDRGGEASGSRPSAPARVAQTPLGARQRARGGLAGIDDALDVGAAAARRRGASGRQLGQLRLSGRKSHGLPHARARHDGRVGLRRRRLAPSTSSARRAVPWRAAPLRPAGNSPRDIAVAPRPAGAA